MRPSLPHTYRALLVLNAQLHVGLRVAALWGLDEDIQSWGYSVLSGEELSYALFSADPIEWNRVGAFQDVCLTAYTVGMFCSHSTVKPLRLCLLLVGDDEVDC